MIISVDIRENALFDELKYSPPKTMREYTVLAASRMCGIHLDGDGDGDGQCENAANPVTGPDQPDEEPATAASGPVICKHESHTLRKQRLVIGDVVIQQKHSDADTVADADAVDVILFERKTLNDLAASIRDGRYKEQSFRLNQYCELENHNVIYVIEGDMAKYIDKAKSANPITKKALYSAMFSMMYLKGFSVFRTANIRETADLILYFADKYDAVPLPERKPYYANKHKTSQPLPEPVTAATAATAATSSGDYSGMFKYKERSSQITPDNIGEIMISAIPFVNSKTASAIMAEYKTVPNLIDAMKKDRACLNNIYIQTQTQSTTQTTTITSKRKISKLCVDNLFKFLIG
jgi:ERCC4-type nuclease